MNQKEQKHWEDNKEWNDGGWKIAKEETDNPKPKEKLRRSDKQQVVCFVAAILTFIISVFVGAILGLALIIGAGLAVTAGLLLIGAIIVKNDRGNPRNKEQPVKKTKKPMTRAEANKRIREIKRNLYREYEAYLKAVEQLKDAYTKTIQNYNEFVKAYNENRADVMKAIALQQQIINKEIDQINDSLDQENNKPLPYKNLYNKNHRPARWSDSTSPEQEVERHLNGELDYSDMSDDAQVLFEEEYNDD